MLDLDSNLKFGAENLMTQQLFAVTAQLRSRPATKIILSYTYSDVILTLGKELFNTEENIAATTAMVVGFSTSPTRPVSHHKC